MVVFDATMLMLAVNPAAGRPLDPVTQKPVDHVEQRINFMLSEIDKARVKIGIPSPALSEAIVRSKMDPADIIKLIQGLSVFEILPFDERAAIEVALINKSALSSGDKRDGSDECWSKIKYDRQIAAIAKVKQASTIYTDDRGLRNTCGRINLKVLGLSDLILPPAAAQMEIAFHPASTDLTDLDEDEREDEHERT